MTTTILNMVMWGLSDVLTRERDAGIPGERKRRGALRRTQDRRLAMTHCRPYVILAFIASALHAQNCSGTSTGRVPLDDLGVGTYLGFVGGLYPGGQNARPPAHEAAGLAAAAGVVPRLSNG